MTEFGKSFTSWISPQILKITLMVFIASSFSTPLFSGAWLQKKHQHFIKVKFGYHSSGDEFDHLGNVKSILEDFVVFENTLYREVTIGSYFEYGFFDRLTLVADVPFKVATSERREVTGYGIDDRVFTTSGFSDLTLAARIGILNGPVVLSLQPAVKIPLGYETATTQEGPRLGTGEIDYESRIQLGISLHPLPLYATADAGYRLRQGLLHDEYFFVLETGVNLQKFLFKMQFVALQNTTTPPDIYGGRLDLPLEGGGGVVPLRLFGDQDFSKLSGEILYWASEDIGVSGEVFHLVAGKNIVTGTSFQVGLVIR